MNATASEVFYFGEPAAPLFGALERPASASPTAAALLCHPTGHEYIQCHRTFRLLSTALARVGMTVLRFDYSGCGDSGGEPEAGTVSSWRGDVTRALELVRRRQPEGTLCVVGARLGAALAVLESRRADVDTLVLWDPVVRGDDYLTELRLMHREALKDVHVASPATPDGEILGFPLTPEQERQILDLDLAEVDEPPARRALLLEGGALPAVDDLAGRLEALGVVVDRRPVRDGTDPWAWVEDVGRVVTATGVVDGVTEWLAAVEEHR